jgi:hypothetical protein
MLSKSQTFNGKNIYFHSLQNYCIQYTSESRTVPAFGWSISAGPDLAIAGPTKTRKKNLDKSLDRFVMNKIFL